MDSALSNTTQEVTSFWENIDTFFQQATGNHVVGSAISMALILVVTALVAHGLTKLIRKASSRNGSVIPATSIFVNIERVLVWGIGICLILYVCFDVNVSGIIAALGIGGIAISLGMQDTITNLLSGLQLNVMGTIKPGDHVQISAIDGVISDINWRYTTITVITGENVLVPNSMMTSNALSIMPPWHSVKVAISLPYAAAAYYESCGSPIDKMLSAMAASVQTRLTESAPAGLGLKLAAPVTATMRLSGEYAYNVSLKACIDPESVDENFSRLAVEDAMLRASVEFTSKSN